MVPIYKKYALSEFTTGPLGGEKEGAEKLVDI